METGQTRGLEQVGHEPPPDPLPAPIRMEVDRALGGEPIPAARTIRSQRGVADHRSAHVGHQHRIAPDPLAPPRGSLLGCTRLLLPGAGGVHYIMVVYHVDRD